MRLLCFVDFFNGWLFVSRKNKILKKEEFVMCVMVTKEAPDFTAQAVMPDGSMGEITLSSFRGDKYVLLFFYPLDFTFV